MSNRVTHMIMIKTCSTKETLAILSQVHTNIYLIRLEYTRLKGKQAINCSRERRKAVTVTLRTLSLSLVLTGCLKRIL